MTDHSSLNVEMFEELEAAAPNAMIMADSGGVISFANAPVATAFGFPAKVQPPQAFSARA